MANAQRMSLFRLIFENCSYINPEDAHIKNLVNLLEATAKENEQKKYIKQIVDKCKLNIQQKVENTQIKNLVLVVFSKYGPKKEFKKFLQSIIGDANFSTFLVRSTTEEILKKINNKKCNIQQCYDLMNFVYLMQNTSIFQYEVLIPHLFPLYCVIYEGFVYHVESRFQLAKIFLKELFTLMNAVLKQILTGLVKTTPYTETISNQYSTKLIVLSHAVIKSEEIHFDLRSKAGLIIAYSCDQIPQTYRQHFKYKECPILGFIEDYNDERYFLLMNRKLPVFTDCESTLIIYASISAIIPHDKLVEIKIEGRPLVLLLYDGLMECAKKQIIVPNVAIEISRILSIIGKHLVLVPPKVIKPIFVDALAYCASHVDHFVDTVRGYARQFFAEIIKVAAYHRNKENEELTDVLVEYCKKLLTTETMRFLSIESIAQEFGANFLIKNFSNLLDVLLNGIADPTISDQVCKTYIAVMEKHFQEAEKDEWIKFWIIPVTKVLKNCNNYTTVCQRIMTRAFQLHPPILKTIYPPDYVGNPQECRVLLKCLQQARVKAIQITDRTNINSGVYYKDLIDINKFYKFAVHQDDEIRMAVLSVIVDTRQTAEIFMDFEFDFLMKFLHYNVTSQIPNVRKHIVSCYKKMLSRFNASYHVLTRNVNSIAKSPALVGNPELKRVQKLYEEVISAYGRFISTLTQRLVSYLSVDSNYYRRSVSLELLIDVQKILQHEQWRQCWSDEDVRNCHNILFDNYESNKKMALTLLKTLPYQSIGFTNLDFTFKYMQRCLSMALEIKPSKTLSATYLFEVCTLSPHFYDIVQCTEGLSREMADSNLDMIVVLVKKLRAHEMDVDDIFEIRTAHYGILFSIRHLLEKRDINRNNHLYARIFQHLTVFCMELKNSIMQIVCDPAPEGYLPSNNEELCDRDESSKTQRIVCFAWRTIKEITLLLAELVKQTVALENKTKMLSETFLTQIGKFFFRIFIESRHRGVFEKAYVGFSVVCASFWVSKHPKINSLPKAWLSDALAYCTGKEETDKLCANRRSAGLPLLILGILSAETTFDKPYFNSAMETLMEICENPEPSSDECKIHCMNVLRMIFRDSKLGESVSVYNARGMVVVMNCFKSSSWRVRNSSTLLFASLMTRIFGVQRTQTSDDLCIKNKSTIKVFFLRYPSLFSFFFNTLKEECRKNESLVLHPLLMVLARLYPSQADENKQQTEQYLPHITAALSNSLYSTRELAARSSAPFLLKSRVSDHIVICFAKIKSTEIRDNECQGFLLQIWHLLKSNTDVEVPLTKCLYYSIHLLQYAGKHFSHMTITLYMEVLLLLLMRFKDYRNIDLLKAILGLLSRQIATNSIPLTSMGKFPQTRMLFILYIIINKFEECELTYPTVTNQIMSQLYGHNIEMKRFCLYLLIYMNQIQNDSTPKHALFQMEELEVPQEIVKVVDSFEKQCVKKILTHIHPYLKCFLTEEIRFQHYIKKEDQVLLFLLLNYYPCVIKYLNLSKQETLNTLINFCNCDSEELISAVISCISTFLLQLDYNVLSYSELIKVLVESASPVASDFKRLAVCDFLAKNYILYCNEEPIMSGDDLQMVLSIVMVLLEDEEQMVRNAMSAFAMEFKIIITLNKSAQQTISGLRMPVLPEKAREDLLNLCFITLPRYRAVCFLFSWACRHFPESSYDSSEVFERGDVNLYAENVSFMDLCITLLHKLLWPLDDGLSYEDKSIFIEEHTLLVTTILMDSLIKHPSPMMLYKTKLSVICALKSTIKFLERFEINDNFVNRFNVYLNETILGYLTKQVEHSDLYSVKKVIRKIYEPILNFRSTRE